MWTWYALANNWFIVPMLLATGTALMAFSFRKKPVPELISKG
jgi:ABC-type uncharacterized transport system involved in gliding motility auxiliary subunit